MDVRFEGVEGGVGDGVVGEVGVVIVVLVVLTDGVVMITLNGLSLRTSLLPSGTSWEGGDVCKEGSVFDVVVGGVGDVGGVVIIVRNVDGEVESGMGRL